MLTHPIIPIKGFCLLILIVAESNIVFGIEGQGLRSHWEVAKTGRELSAPVLNMLVVNLLFSFLTHFRFTDNQHDQGRGRASFAKIFGVFWKLVGKPIHCHFIVNSLFAEVRALEKRHESVDKKSPKKMHRFEISCRINFWGYVALDGQEKGRGWESFGGKWVYREYSPSSGLSEVGWIQCVDVIGNITVLQCTSSWIGS